MAGSKKVKSELIVFSPAYPQFKNKSGQADMLLRVNKNKFPDLFSTWNERRSSLSLNFILEDATASQLHFADCHKL